MISYIFKSKIKNTLVTAFSAILIYIKFSEIYKCIILGAWDYVVLKFIGLLPYVLVFLYMVILKKEHKIKQLLFPIAFIILVLCAIFSIRDCFDEYTFTSINGLIRLFINLSVKFIMIMGYSFCFVGTLSNFKRINFFRCGLLICSIKIFVQGVFYHCLIDWIGNEFYSIVYYLSEAARATVLLLFYISVFILTLTKKSEYIDITHFVEERKIKKANKKAKKLEKEKSEEFLPPDIPDDYWRCMGCGEILSDDKSVCECGYKR